MNIKIIACDFDGTLCENQWPDIGSPNLKLISYLKEQQEQGSKIILWTCRTGERLDEAVRFCFNHDLVFDAINENIPETLKWFDGYSRKIFAHEYIDDRACIRFNLPFKTESGISVETLKKVEYVLNYPLDSWQWDFLKGDQNARSLRNRGIGKRMTLCLSILLTPNISVDIEDPSSILKACKTLFGVDFVVDDVGTYFIYKLRELDYILTSNGVTTNAIKKVEHVSISDETLSEVKKYIE